jgi:hypothetical protein
MRLQYFNKEHGRQTLEICSILQRGQAISGNSIDNIVEYNDPVWNVINNTSLI